MAVEVGPVLADPAFHGLVVVHGARLDYRLYFRRRHIPFGMCRGVLFRDLRIIALSIFKSAIRCATNLSEL